MIGPNIYRELFDAIPSKSQQRMIEIAEAAISTYVKVGIDSATYEKIAKSAKVSRPLIIHYFPNYESLFIFVAKYIGAVSHNFVLERILPTLSDEDSFQAYIRACFDWAESHPKHAKAWLLFYFYCATKPKFESLNTRIVNMGLTRIALLLENGKKANVFQCEDSRTTARHIQIQILGALVSLITEARDSNTQLRDQTTKLCLELARHP